MDQRNLIIAIIVGIVAGWLASLVVGGYGIVQYLISGILGSFVGSFVLNRLGINLGIRNEMGRDIVTATIGAVIVVIIARILH
ncbi:MAG: GlsB/YeaQ/YmgE family stress response membrane protein [Aestuariivirga sp.]